MTEKQNSIDLVTPLSELCANPYSEDRLDTHARFCIERHLVYLRRSLGMPKPWTTDPVLQNYRFCNIFRELDTVSVWIIENIIKPYENHPNLPVMLCLARLINWPETLQEMMDKGVFPVDTWNWRNAYAVLADKYYNRKEKTITGAYIVNSVYPQGQDVKDACDQYGNGKVHYIPHYGIDPIWQDREEFSANMRVSMRQAVETLKQYHGWAEFMSYQVAVDLSYSKRWLGLAPDLNEYTSPGPGTRKGQHFLLTGVVEKWSSIDGIGEAMRQMRPLANQRIRELMPAKLFTGNFQTGFADMTMSNYSNSLCEFSKWLTISTNVGKMRSRYNGVK
jgi:hypothetical protein